MAQVLVRGELAQCLMRADGVVGPEDTEANPPVLVPMVVVTDMSRSKVLAKP